MTTPVADIKANDSTRSFLELLYHISRELSSELDLRTLLQRVLFLSMQNVGAINGSIIVLDDDGTPVDSAIITGDRLHEHTTDRLQETLERGLTGWVVRNRQAAVVANTSQDERWMPRQYEQDEIQLPKSAVSVPIITRDKLVGVLTLVHPQTGFFNPDHLALVQAIADLAGTAIRHALLYEQLKAAHQQYQELFEDSIDPILITDWEGQIVQANRKAVLTSDRSKEALIAMRIDQIHQVDQASLGEGYQKVHSSEPVSYESILHTASGHEVPIRVYVREILLDDTSRLQWILRDITEQKKLDTLRDDLTSMIYHDLRSPLANVVSSLDLLEAMLPSDDPALKSLLDISMHSVERIQRMTESLLDLSTLEAGQPIGQRNRTNFLVLISEAVKAVEPQMHNKNQVLKYSVPDHLPEISVDQEMIRRVVTNLLENASKYSPQGSNIEIGARREGDHILAWVRDNGPGIPASEYERIFDKFTRLKPQDKMKGLGLGLAYCRLAVLAHGGKIWVESEMGGGSRFCFTLPAVTP